MDDGGGDRWGEGVSVGETGQDLDVGTGPVAAHLTSAFLWEKTRNFEEKGGEEEAETPGEEECDGRNSDQQQLRG